MFAILWLLTNLFGRLDIEMPVLHEKDTILEVFRVAFEALEKHINEEFERLNSTVEREQDRNIRLLDENTTLKREKQEAIDAKFAAMQKNGNSFLLSRLMAEPGHWNLLLGQNMTGQIDTFIKDVIDPKMGYTRKIEAIKLLRMEFNFGLKEAKDAVEAREDFLRPIPF